MVDFDRGFRRVQECAAGLRLRCSELICGLGEVSLALREIERECTVAMASERGQVHQGGVRRKARGAVPPKSEPA